MTGNIQRGAKTTVIIPAYNREAYIGTAIRSLLRQRQDADLDIVVVDDGSTDATAAIVTELAASTPAIRLIRQPNGGVAKARNTGLDNIHADAAFVTFLDSDDISVAGRFAAELPLFADDPTLAMTYSLMTLSNGLDDALLAPLPEAATCTLRGISLTTAIFRRDVIARIGRFEEGLKQAEDLDFLLRFFELSLKYRLVDNVSILYRRHIGNTTSAQEETRRCCRIVLGRSALRRGRAGVTTPIPKFYDFSSLRAEQYASLR